MDTTRAAAGEMQKNYMNSPVRRGHVAIKLHVRHEEEEGRGEDGDEADDNEGRQTKQKRLTRV